MASARRAGRGRDATAVPRRIVRRRMAMAARDTWYAGSEAFAALEERMAREIATAARRATLEVARADSCVLTTRAIVAVCARLHLPARPLTCGAVAVNRAWLDCVVKWG